jgi:hypothetical protein
MSGRQRGTRGVAFLIAIACAGAGVAETWIDLTHPFDAQTIYWPTEKGFQFDAGANGPTAKGYYYAANRFTTAEHGGTHLDAPRHFSATGQTSDAGRPARGRGCRRRCRPAGGRR